MLLPNRLKLLIAFVIWNLTFVMPAQAGTTPPVTSHTFSGTEGLNGWYVSTVDVELRAIDLESGPKQTTYWLNDDPPTTEAHTSGPNVILNPSFEEGGFFGGIDYWDDRGNALFWQSGIEHKFGDHSAGIIVSDEDFSYWHNRDDAVTTVPLQSYSVSAWAKTYDVVGLGVYFEVWAKGADWDQDLLIGQSDSLTGTNDWTMLSVAFIMPEGSDQVYLRLGAKEESLIGIVYWDGVSMYGGYEALTEFTVVQNGNHVLHYFSEDNNGNVEGEKEALLLIDTKGPTDWSNFSFAQGSNNHSYLSTIEVLDVTSGADVSEAKYRYYTDHQDAGWSDWFNVAQVLRVSDGSPAVDGETSPVRLETPEVDFGDSSTVFSVQFQLADMAGNSSDSSPLTIEGPWIKLEGADLYVGASINMSASAPGGVDNSNAVISAGGSINNFSTSTNWEVTSYSHTHQEVEDIGDLINDFDDLKQNAAPLPQQRLPQTDGVYLYDDDYTIDSQSTPAGFEDNVLSAVVIIEGDLRIKIDYSLQPSSAAVFLVEGDIEIEGAVEEIGGFFIAEGEIDTNIDNKQKKQLRVNGGLVSLEGFILGRNLGRTGVKNNNTDPAELFVFTPQYLLSSKLIDLISGGDVDYTWREVGP